MNTWHHSSRGAQSAAFHLISRSGLRWRTWLAVLLAALGLAQMASAQTGTGLRGEYFNNLTVTGTPAHTRTDAMVNFSWGDGAPAPAINIDGFSVRWSGQVQPQFSESYTFYTNTDDGARLWVNGVQLVNDWTNHGTAEHSGSVTLVAGQAVQITMEYFDSGGGAVAELRWSSPSTPKAVIPQNRLYPPGGVSGTGLRGQYFANETMTGSPALTRTDGTVNFTWNDIPAPGLPADHFSVYWSGQVQPEFSESYTFTTNADDGVRLWVNGTSLIDDWHPHAPEEHSGTITLTGGQKYDLELEYYENLGGAVAQLYWASPTQAKQIIPQGRLYPTMAQLSGVGLKGDYFSNPNLTGSPSLTRTDATVSFDWGGNSPGGTLPIDNFSVRWAGQIQPGVTDTYTFFTNTDDGVRLWVNGQFLVDDWTGHPPTERTGTPALSLNAGQKYDIVMEYYEGGGGASAQLLWSSPLTPKAIVPTVHLYPTTSGGGGNPTEPISILNFGFETPSVGAGNFQYAPTGGTWSFSGAGIAANGSGFTGSNPGAPQGSQVAFIQGNGNFQQSVGGFAADVPYTLTFAAAQRSFSQAGNTWRVTLDGEVLGTFAPPQTATNYIDYSTQFTTEGGTFVLAFEATNLNGGDNTVLIDNIRIVPTGGTNPPPSPPSAPTGLAASSVSNSQINLSWTDTSNNETGFKIERKTGAGAFAQIATVGANATTYGSAGLSANTAYVFRVRAYNGDGDSNYTNDATATTSAVGDPKLTGTVMGTSGSYQNDPNVTKEKAMDGSLTTFYDAAAGNGAWVGLDLGSSVSKAISKVRFAPRMALAGRMVGGKFQGSNNATFASGVTDLFTIGTAPAENVYTEQTIGNATGFRYVRYLSPNDGWGNVAEVEFYGHDAGSAPTTPAPPSNLVAQAISSNQINLTWTDASNDETGFKIERKTGSGGTYAEITTVAANATSYASTGLSANTNYVYRVRATNAAGDSTHSNEANATTQTAAGFQNPGVYSQVVNGLLYEWIPTTDVNFQILPDGKVKIIAPLTKRSSNNNNDCQRFIYDHNHKRLSTAEANALFGSGLTLPVGNHGFAILWLNATSYDDVLARGWDLTANPATYLNNSCKTDYFNLSIVPVSPGTPPGGQVQEIVIPHDLQRVSWLPHYQVLPYNLTLPADRGFGTTRMLMDVPLEQVYQKVTQIQYMYGFLDPVPYAKKWKVLRAYPGETVSQLIQNAPIDVNYGYMSQMDEDFGNMGISDHLQRAQQVYQGIYQRMQNEQGVTSPNQTRLYDDYFSDFGGFSTSENFRFNFNAANMVAGLSSQTMARKRAGGVDESSYFSGGAYNYRNWIQGGYLDSFERIPEGIRIYNEIYNFEKRFMAAPDRRVAKMGWTNAEGVNSEMYRGGTESRLHFPNGDIIRSVEVAWPFHMMLNESFWTVLLGNDYYLWHSSVPLVTGIEHFGDSWAAGAGPTKWQPTGGAITNYDQNNPSHPQRTSSPLGQFPNNPHLGESGAFTGAWLVSQITSVSDRISLTMEYCPFSYKINGGAAQQGYYNSNNPTNGSLGNAKLSRAGVANYGQSNIVKTFEAKKPICIYTAGANGSALIYHNVYCGLTDVNEVTITTPLGTRTFQVTGNSLHVFYLN